MISPMKNSVIIEEKGFSIKFDGNFMGNSSKYFELLTMLAFIYIEKNEFEMFIKDLDKMQPDLPKQLHDCLEEVSKAFKPIFSEVSKLRNQSLFRDEFTLQEVTLGILFPVENSMKKLIHSLNYNKRIPKSLLALQDWTKTFPNRNAPHPTPCDYLDHSI